MSVLRSVVCALVLDGTRYFWYHHSDGDTMDKLIRARWRSASR
ncbi:MAG: hypothetical protein ABIW94_06420 [Gemmatimonadaceae bacterium]